MRICSLSSAARWNALDATTDSNNTKVRDFFQAASHNPVAKAIGTNDSAGVKNRIVTR